MMRVLLADDHTLFREGVRSLLATETDIEVVGQASNGLEAIQMAEQLLPDVIVMDLMMPVMSGIEATRRIKVQLPDTKVLVLSMYDDEEYVQQLLAAGASGCILKRATSEELVKALREVVSGGMPLDPHVAARLVKDYVRLVQVQGTNPTPEIGPNAVLTPRECEILKLIAEGNTNVDIADRLGLSRKTVEVHRTNLMRKLDLHDVTELVKYAIRHNMIVLTPRE
jgi:two-component system, NarL family, response regulator NreC